MGHCREAYTKAGRFSRAIFTVNQWENLTKDKSKSTSSREVAQHLLKHSPCRSPADYVKEKGPTAGGALAVVKQAA